MTRRATQTPSEKLEVIRDWFARHRRDYDPVNINLPPKVWSEHFAYLLERIDELERELSADVRG